jgi:predicted unusual protein kinase regulating ubiquinone biosynthesis (AarF/ABC1/UbiB family)
MDRILRTVHTVPSHPMACMRSSIPCVIPLCYVVIERELGKPVGSIFSQISLEPVAAASLGQVYRAVLASDGQQVAVKVQRPGVVEMIAMDVFILRCGRPHQKAFPQSFLPST